MVVDWYFDFLSPFLHLQVEGLCDAGEGDVVVTRKDYLELLFPELSGAGINSSVLIYG